jgi:chitin disaccharide deacetylase
MNHTTSRILAGLGHSRDAKLLVIHADDLGMAHSVNSASFTGLRRGIITSASVMVVCPWFSEVAHECRRNPGMDIGIHLTLTSEWPNYRWRPLSSPEKVGSLVDDDGYFWKNEALFSRHAKAAEVELEVRAQIEAAITAGMQPTHLDSHMLALWNRADLYQILPKISRTYRIPFLGCDRFTDRQKHEARHPIEEVIFEKFIMADRRVSSSCWREYYGGIIEELPPGISQLIVHVGSDDEELRAITANITDFGSAWRSRDYDAIMDPAFYEALIRSNIKLIGWKHIGVTLGLMPLVEV